MQSGVIIDGRIQNWCPVDLRPLPPVRVSTESEIRSVMASSREAQGAWEKTGFEARARLMKRAGRRLIERRWEAMGLLSDEAGKGRAEMLLSEVAGPLQYIKDWISVSRPYLKPRGLPLSALAFPGKRGVIERVPRGVVGVIAPWNYPLGNFFKPVFAALLAGNSVVLKPSEYSPRTAEWFVKVIGEFLPSGVLSLVQGDRDVGRSLIRAGIDAVTFTGSFFSGQEVARLAAEEMIPCSLELGGKDAAIILSDCDLDRTVAGVMYWALHNSGQGCGDIERLYVENPIADRFIGRLVAAVSALRTPGGPLRAADVGPTVHARQLAVIEDQVADAVSRGARVLCGGKRRGEGLWYLPTVLDRCDHSMKVMREPTFGPVIPLCRVEDADQAVRLANDCDYGLNGSIWSCDLRRAGELARRLQVGTAYVNNHAFTGAVVAAPWTGVKNSGYGVANSAVALSHYTRPRTVVIDRNRACDAWWFPMDGSAEELGHCLAEAQLGSVWSILRLPWLIAQRRRRVLRFVREGARASEDSPGFPEGGTWSGCQPGWLVTGLVRFRLALLRSGKFIFPPLTQRELRWGQAAIEAIFFEGNPGNPGNPTPRKSLALESTGAGLRDLYRHMPILPGLALRAALWIAGLAPILRRKKWKTLDQLPVADRLAVLAPWFGSDSYLLRQIVFPLKMAGSLVHLRTSRFHEVFASRATTGQTQETSQAGKARQGVPAPSHPAPSRMDRAQLDL